MLGSLCRRLLPALGRAELRTPGAALRACAATCASSRLQEDCLVLDYGGKPMRFNFVWLRDHCRSASSYNPDTHQRELDTESVELSIRPDSARVEDGHLLLTWPGGHVSKYSLSWLAENSYEAQKQKTVQPRILWNSDIYNKANIPSAKWDTFMSSDDELKKFLQNYVLYGIAFVDDVPATVEATEAVTQRVSLIRIQVFHCLKHEGTGGKTLLVDGFYAAEKLRQKSPENFELLTHVPIRHEYIESTGNHRNHMTGIGPVLNVYPWNNELYLIRYNNYDRSVINTVPHDLVQRWYVAHRELTTELRQPENELWVKLTPGKVRKLHFSKGAPLNVCIQRWPWPENYIYNYFSIFFTLSCLNEVIFIDNWRVMHGRESFTGLRQLCGCYLTRDDILSSARCFGLQA
ncbi:hypothetical protein L3Q82_022108 [Scortum barcoo]|uniref:Uncharacterized protein n=1 Tax=Scortum barcoo TaxID=214431 RepID=A0ACB8X0L9_9TELE|nr:hypothetical protein L3Q82_022108 [Scortum barcoo]